MASPIRCVVFDLGGVVLGSPLHGIKLYEEKYGIPLGYINVSIVSKGRAGAFQRLERGELSMSDFYREFRTELGEPENIKSYIEYLNRKRRPIPDNLPKSFDINTVELFDEFMMKESARINPNMCHALFLLKGLGYTVVALTNNWQHEKSDENGAKDSSSTNLLNAFFDNIIESSVIGLRKPDPRIYQYTCDLVGMQPNEIAFLDDIGLNLSAARKFGWSTVKVNIGETDQALSQLAAILKLRNDIFKPQVTQSRKIACNAGAAGGEIVMSLFGHAANPVVVFLHGGGQTRHTWEKTAIKFAQQGYCAITVDMKGHGESYHDKRTDVDQYGRYQMFAFAEDLDRIVEKLKLPNRPRGYALVGASLGGLSILGSHAAKDTAKAIVLVDITPKMELGGVSRIVHFMKKTAVEGFDSLEDAARTIAVYKSQGGSPASTNTSFSREGLESLKKNLRQLENGRWTWHWDPEFISPKDASEEDMIMFEKALYEHAGNTETPCLLVRGRQTDLVTSESAQAFVKRMPNASYVDVDQASHMVVGDRNDIFADETLKFLVKHLTPTPNPKL